MSRLTKNECCQVSPFTYGTCATLGAYQWWTYLNGPNDIPLYSNFKFSTPFTGQLDTLYLYRVYRKLLKITQFFSVCQIPSKKQLCNQKNNFSLPTQKLDVSHTGCSCHSASPSNQKFSYPNYMSVCTFADPGIWRSNVMH